MKRASATSAERPLSVTEISHRITRLLEDGIGRVWIEGEVSNLRVPASGHAYFVLKDEGAALNAVCFRGALAQLRVKLESGAKLEVYGRVTAYSARSEYQIIVERARESGLGELMRRYLELRDKLKAEGIFDEARKRPLPPYPRAVGIVTSSTGAALRDMLTVLRRRAPGLTIYIAPASVQGDAAPGEIVSAIRRLLRDGRSEVIICGRGGGSIEDLWAFNDERVVRAIAASKIPVVSAVGHETDTTLADFAADLRAPTPSAAAEIVTRNYHEVGLKVARYSESIVRSMARGLRDARSRLSSCSESWGMRRPLQDLASAQQRADDLAERLSRGVYRQYQERRLDLTARLKALASASPAGRIAGERDHLANLKFRLQTARPDVRWKVRIDLGRIEGRQLRLRLQHASLRRNAEKGLRLQALVGRLGSLAPESILRRGYSIVTSSNGRKILTGPGQARTGENLRIQSRGGTWRAAALGDEPELFDNAG